MSHMLQTKTYLALLFAVVSAVAATAQDDPALTRLNESPRHHEWVTVARGDREVRTFVVYPERSEKTLAVVIIHENRGLTDWVRSVADQVAETGYIAVAPDLLSGMGPDGGATNAFADTNAARDALYEVPQGQVTADLNAVLDYAKTLDAANGKVAVAGFCWGGKQAFDLATERADLAAAFVFYGSAPEDAAAYANIQSPVYGFYGEDDARITAAVPDTEEKMKAAGKTYEVVIYDEAGHGFMRSGEEAGAKEANQKAMAQGWARWKELLAKL
jgi:carboxymethylenebutenolidase